MCDHFLSRRAFFGLVPAGLAESEPAKWVEPLFRRQTSPGGGPRIALTLDACQGGIDSRIVNVLIQQRIAASIFLTQRWMHGNHDGLAMLLDHQDLFAFENHGARHLVPILGDGAMFGLPIAGTLANVRREVEEGSIAIRDATGLTSTWYRGATARYSPEALPEIQKLGFKIAAYSLSADLGASLPAAKVARRMLNAKDGDVIIGHINQPHRSSGEGIAQGILELRNAGFSFVHLNELNPVLARDPPAAETSHGGRRKNHVTGAGVAL